MVEVSFSLSYPHYWVLSNYGSFQHCTYHLFVEIQKVHTPLVFYLHQINWETSQWLLCELSVIPQTTGNLYVDEGTKP